jgi:hypothetical protein
VVQKLRKVKTTPARAAYKLLTLIANEIKQPLASSRGVSTLSTGSRLPHPSFPRTHVLSTVEGRESRFSVFVTPSPPWMPACAGIQSLSDGYSYHRLRIQFPHFPLSSVANLLQGVAKRLLRQLSRARARPFPCAKTFDCKLFQRRLIYRAWYKPCSIPMR